MKIIRTRSEISAYTLQQKQQGKRIGFVPTMGALHQGHISLINLAKKRSDLVVCSIFVNPTQFNDPKDLEKYPRPIEHDIAKLEEAACDILFMPEVAEMYSKDEEWQLALDGLDEVLEGKHRPGHYQGVTQIVYKLFSCTHPNIAFFGQKDYQQVQVIEKMVQKLKLDVALEMCPIIREADGLAMSSRNVHLSPTERVQSLALYQSLNHIKEGWGKKSVETLKQEAIEFLEKSPGIHLGYLEICTANNLQNNQPTNQSEAVALVAASLGQTRLIDNILLP
ncbi:MAG: pantoate--beta-alanine ligase [Sphingobacteriales bacterium]|nr:pantoate--beta-alanine ligase [Sphingobacteriales bacterium]